MASPTFALRFLSPSDPWKPARWCARIVASAVPLPCSACWMARRQNCMRGSLKARRATVGGLCGGHVVARTPRGGQIPGGNEPEEGALLPDRQTGKGFLQIDQEPRITALRTDLGQHVGERWLAGRRQGRRIDDRGRRSGE